MKATDKIIKAFEKFNQDLRAFGDETGETYVTLYEDANTTRRVREFKLYKNGKLTWWEVDNGFATRNTEQMFDEDEAKEYLSFWKTNLRRAKRYWAMDIETLDAIQDGEIEDREDE